MPTSLPLESSGSPIIRRIRRGEGARLRAIRIEALTDTPDAFASTLEGTQARPADYWEARVADEESVIFIAEDAGRWVGIVGGYPDAADGGSGMDLISMWVHPAHRRQGLARRLVDCIIDWARERGAQRVILEVTEDNEPARALYAHMGFRVTGEPTPHPSNPTLRERRMVLEL